MEQFTKVAINFSLLATSDADWTLFSNTYSVQKTLISNWFWLLQPALCGGSELMNSWIPDLWFQNTTNHPRSVGNLWFPFVQILTLRYLLLVLPSCPETYCLITSSASQGGGSLLKPCNFSSLTQLAFFELNKLRESSQEYVICNFIQ